MRLSRLRTELRQVIADCRQCPEHLLVFIFIHIAESMSSHAVRAIAGADRPTSARAIDEINLSTIAQELWADQQTEMPALQKVHTAAQCGRPLQTSAKHR